jgi:hypothetical protein
MPFEGNGGGELLALDMSKRGPWPIICFDPFDPKGGVEKVFNDFSSLLAQSLVCCIDRLNPQPGADIVKRCHKLGHQEHRG